MESIKLGRKKSESISGKRGSEIEYNGVQVDQGYDVRCPGCFLNSGLNPQSKIEDQY